MLHNTVNWCFDLKNIQEANRRVVDTIHSLDLANNYVYKPSVIHSSSDGRKVNASVDSLHANYAFKYFGRDKGVTMYTLKNSHKWLFFEKMRRIILNNIKQLGAKTWYLLLYIVGAPKNAHLSNFCNIGSNDAIKSPCLL